MLFWNRKNREEEKQDEIKKEFNPYGLNDILFFIKRETGIDLLVKKGITEPKIKLFCERKEIFSFKELYEKIKTDIKLKQELINLLTVSETYFFREEIQLDAAVSFIKNRRVKSKILCAPSASGEEVYSLAIKFDLNGIGDLVDILGVDINSDVVEKAKKGVYSKRSVHKLSDELKKRYFTKEGDNFLIRESRFANVSFRCENIFNLNYELKETFDIIFSRNMLIYFDEETRLKSMEIFSKLLKPHGKLYLGHADTIPQNRWLERESLCYRLKK